MDQLQLSNSLLSRIRRDGRRSPRIARCLPVLLRWQEAGGELQHAAAQTLCLSRYGCVLTCESRLRVATELWLEYSAAQQSARARVVYRELSAQGPATLAVEFLDDDDFWAQEFEAFNSQPRMI